MKLQFISDEKYVTLAGQLKGLEPLPQPEAGQEYCYQLASVQAMLKVGRTLVFSEDKMDAFYEKIMEEFKDTEFRMMFMNDQLHMGHRSLIILLPGRGKITTNKADRFLNIRSWMILLHGSQHRRHIWMPLNHIGIRSDLLVLILRRNLNLSRHCFFN